MGYEGGYPMMEDKAMMMKPYKMGHSPKEMKGHGKATKTGRPAVLRHMSS